VCSGPPKAGWFCFVIKLALSRSRGRDRAFHFAEFDIETRARKSRCGAHHFRSRQSGSTRASVLIARRRAFAHTRQRQTTRNGFMLISSAQLRSVPQSAHGFRSSSYFWRAYFTAFNASCRSRFRQRHCSTRKRVDLRSRCGRYGDAKMCGGSIVGFYFRRWRGVQPEIGSRNGHAMSKNARHANLFSQMSDMRHPSQRFVR